MELDRRLSPGGPVERALEARLKEEVRRLPSGGNVLGVQLDAHDLLAVRSVPDVFAHGLQVAGDLLVDPERLPDPHHLVVEDCCARQVIELRIALEDQHPVTLPAEHCRRRLPHRAVTDDRHVAVELGHRLSMWVTAVTRSMAIREHDAPDLRERLVAHAARAARGSR